MKVVLTFTTNNYGGVIYVQSHPWHKLKKCISNKVLHDPVTTIIQLVHTFSGP